MTKKLFVLFICILIMLLSAGCWSKKEPKDLAIANSVLYNKVGNTCQVVTEFMGKSSSKEEGSNTSITITSYGDTFREAIADSALKVEKNLYGGHVHVRLFSESVAKEDITDELDFLLRDHLTDETPLIVIVKGEHPEQIYDCSIGLSDSLGVYINAMSASQPKVTSNSVFVPTLNFIRDFFDDGKEPVAGVVHIGKSEKEERSPNSDSASGGSGGSSEESQTAKKSLVYEGLAAFKDGKLVGYFNGIEARAYNIITGDIGMAFISVPLRDSYVICEVTDASSDIKAKIEDKNATIDVKIKTKIRIIADGSDLDVSEPNVMKEIEGLFNQRLLPEIVSAIAKAQTEFKSDIFGFGNSVHSQHPEQWKKIKKDWSDIFSKATVSVSVESSVFQTGEIRDSVLSEFSED